MLNDSRADKYLRVKDNSDLTYEEEVMLTAMAMLTHQADGLFETWLTKTLLLNMGKLPHVVVTMLDAAAMIEREGCGEKLAEFAASDRIRAIFSQTTMAN